MEFSTSSFAATLVLLVGGLICWANPRRNVNRSVFAVSLTVATWLACSHWATTSVRYGLVWLKLTYLAGGLVPLALWLVKESILSSHRPLDRTWLLRNLHWFVGAGALALAPFTDAFIPPESTDAARLRGWAYYGYYAGLLLSYCGILYGALRNMKTLSGARRLELQVWLCGGCVVVATIYLMIALGTVTQDPVFRHLQTLAVLFFYAGTGYAITTHRIFDARQIHELEPHARCKASGVARQFLTPYGVEFVELKALDKMFIFDIGGPHTYRTIYMDGRAHPAEVVPSNYGHSIGWWEGDTFVVDTVGFNEDFWMDRRGLPHTDQLHTIERFDRLNGNSIQYRVTVDDPGAYTAQWEGGFNLRWNPGQELFEYSCQQANYAHELMVGQEGSTVSRASPIVP